MPNGIGVILKTSVNGPYTYTWKDDTFQFEVDAADTGKTLAQAYNEVGALASAMPGETLSVVIKVIKI